LVSFVKKKQEQLLAQQVVADKLGHVLKIAEDIEKSNESMGQELNMFTFES
jgi:hypothetical protein